MKIPAVGSKVRVSVEQPDIYYYAKSPTKTVVYEGVVARAPHWVGADSFAVRTGNPNYPTSIIRFVDAKSIELVEGKFAGEYTIAEPERYFEVEGSKGQKYIVTKSRGKYTCSCPGFQFRRQCKHVTPEYTQHMK